MSDEYIPEIYMAAPAGGKKVDCYFTNGAVRRYDVNRAIRLGGVFAPLKNQAVFNRSLTVMVVDDIMTTGSTLSECAAELKRAGAAKVWCATLARSHRS